MISGDKYKLFSDPLQEETPVGRKEKEEEEEEEKKRK
jgi:hypothetical protein